MSASRSLSDSSWCIPSFIFWNLTKFQFASGDNNLGMFLRVFSFPVTVGCPLGNHQNSEVQSFSPCPLEWLRWRQVGACTFVQMSTFFSRLPSSCCFFSYPPEKNHLWFLKLFFWSNAFPLPNTNWGFWSSVDCPKLRYIHILKLQ